MQSYDLSALRELVTACYAILIFITRDSRISTQVWTGTNTLPETCNSELKRVSFEVTLSAEILTLFFLSTLLCVNVLKSFSLLLFLQFSLLFRRAFLPLFRSVIEL